MPSPKIPQDNSVDSTLALLSEGYRFISNRCDRYQTDIFKTRLLLQPVICVRGEEATRMFYEPDRFTRKGAIPPTALRLLQDKGSVQTLDRQAHHHRKQMFMSLMTPPSIQQLVELMVEQWHRKLQQWPAMDEIILHREVQEILCRAVCQWAGLPLSETEAKQRTQEFAAMIDGAGAVGPRNWWGLWLRRRTERWGRDLIEAVRGKALPVPAESAAYVTAWHRDLSGKLLDTPTAAVELINFLRPTVAVARYITFAALALHEHPHCGERLRAARNGYSELFTQEVRRFYPFFPIVGGHVQEAFDWRGHHFPPDRWVLLDIYGTNRDPRIWREPETFEPERFRNWDESAFNFIPQGGGEYYHNHRCPGEWITIALVKSALNLLTGEMQYEVPEQDLSLDLSRLPAIPKSRLVLRNVRPR